jgi:hypothetical protein
MGIINAIQTRWDPSDALNASLRPSVTSGRPYTFASVYICSATLKTTQGRQETSAANKADHLAEAVARLLRTISRRGPRPDRGLTA